MADLGQGQTYIDAYDAYTEVALWSSLDEEGDMLSICFDTENLSRETRRAMRADVKDFLDSLDENEIDVSGLSAEDLGHNFWLTRNGHGAGFWDMGLGDLGEVLTKYAKAFGEVWLCVDDDGLIHMV